MIEVVLGVLAWATFIVAIFWSASNQGDNYG